MTVAELRAIITADDTQYQQRMAAVLATSQKAQTQMTSMSSSFDNLGAGFFKAGAAMSAAFTLPLVAVTEMGREFETQLRRVAANTAMTDEELNKMREVVISIGRDTAAPLSDLAHGFEHAANFGFTAAESAKILDIAMQGAVTTGAKTADVANTLAGVLHIFGKSADDASVTMNTLKEAAGKGNLTLEQFVSVSGRVFATAANLGLSLNEAAGAMSALTRAGFPAAQASTQLVGALNHLVNPTKEIQGELARLSQTTGIDLVSDFSQAALQSKGFAAILGDVKKAVGDNTAEALKLFGGLRGGLGVMALIGNASDDYRSILEKLSETMAGKLTPIQDAYAREVVTLSFQLGELTNRFTLLGAELNKSFGGSQAGFIKGVADAVDALTAGLAAADPQATKLITTLLAGLAIGGPIALGIGAIITLLGGPLAIAIVGVTAGLSVLFAESVSGANQGNVAMIDFKTALIQTAQVLGTMLDVIGTVSNAVLILAKTLTLLLLPIGEIIQVIQGDFAGAWHTFSVMTMNGVKSIGESFDNMMLDINGRWSNTLSTMAQNGINSSGAFGAAGTAAGNAFFGHLAQASQRFPIAAFATPTNPLQGGFTFNRPPPKMSDSEQAAIIQGVDAATTAINAKMKPLVVPRLTPPPSGGKGSAKEVIDQTLSLVNDWLRATERNITISDNAWGGMPLAIKNAFDEQQKAFHKSTDNAQIWAATQLVAALKTGEAFAPAIRQMTIEIDDLIPAEKELVGINEAVNRVMESSQPAAADMSASLVMLKAAVKNLKEDIAASPLFDTLKINQETAHAFDEVIRLTEAEGERLGQTTGEIHDNILKNIRKFGVESGGKYAEAGKIAVAAYEREFDKLPGALDQIFNRLFVGAKLQVSGLIQVLENIPGAFGDQLRKSTNVVIDWINKIDQVLKGLHKIWQTIPDGLAGVLQQVVGIFKHVQGQVQDIGTMTQDQIQKTAKGASQGFGLVGDSLNKSGDSASEGAKKWMSALAAIAGALATFFGTRNQGKGIGVLGGALAGAQIGALFGGVGAAIGAGVGALIGLFHTGKSASQKAAEAQAIQQTKLELQKTAQDVVNAAIQAFTSALEFFDKLDQFTEVRKSQFKKFFKSLSLMMDYFVELAKKWSGDSLTKAKALAEAMGPIVDVIAAAPGALDAIGKYLGVAQASIDRFFVDFKLLFDRFAALADETTNHLEKQARKFGERVLPAMELITNTIGALAAMANLKPVSAEAFDILKASLMTFVAKIGELSEFFDKSLLKAIMFFAEKAGPAVDLWKNAVDAINSMAEIKAPSEGAFATLFAGIESAVNGMVDLATRLSTEGLSRAEAVASASLAIFSAVKAGVEALTSLQTYKDVASTVFEAFVADFDAAITMIDQMASRALYFESTAKTFEGYIKSGAAHLATAFEMLRQIMGAAGAFFPGGSPVVVGGESATLASGGGGVAPTSTPQKVSGGNTTNINLGNITISGDDPKARAFMRALSDLLGEGTGLSAVIGQNG